MVDNAVGAIIKNALGAKWSGGELVNKALGAKWHMVLQASLTITHTANVPPNPGRYLSSSQVSVIGDEEVEEHSLLGGQINIEIVFQVRIEVKGVLPI